MSKQVAVTTAKVVPLKPWGEANPQRGAVHMDHAVAFAKLFPINTRISVEQWDNFLSMRNLLTIPNTGPGSDAWTGHVMRRNRLRKYINQAAQHPNILVNYGTQPYRIDILGQPNQYGQAAYIVKATFDIAIADEIGRYIERKIGVKRKQLDVALQGIDINDLTPVEKHAVEQAFMDGDWLARSVRFAAQEYANRMTLVTKMVMSIKSKTSLPAS
jgi:hypothetical protein